MVNQKRRKPFSVDERRRILSAVAIGSRTSITAVMREFQINEKQIRKVKLNYNAEFREICYVIESKRKKMAPTQSDPYPIRLMMQTLKGRATYDHHKKIYLLNGKITALPVIMRLANEVLNMKGKQLIKYPGA